MEDINVGGDGSEVDGDGGGGDGVNGDGSGGTSPSRQGAEIDFCPPKFLFDGGGAAELFWEKCRLF
jgi:hypothetical protein